MSSNICYYCYKFLCSWFFFSVYLSIIFTFFVIKLYNIIFIYLCMCFSLSHSRDHLSFMFVLCLLSTSVILYYNLCTFAFLLFLFREIQLKAWHFLSSHGFDVCLSSGRFLTFFLKISFHLCVWGGLGAGQGMQHYMYT